MAQHIKVEFSRDGLFGAINPGDEGINAEASAASFSENLTNAIYDEYPNADIEVIETINDRHSIDGQTDTIECRYLGALINKVWESYAWEVPA